MIVQPPLEIPRDRILAHNRLGVRISLLSQVLQLHNDFGLRANDSNAK
jgi:hypothetical protein